MNSRQASSGTTPASQITRFLWRQVATSARDNLHWRANLSSHLHTLAIAAANPSRYKTLPSRNELSLSLPTRTVHQRGTRSRTWGTTRTRTASPSGAPTMKSRTARRRPSRPPTGRLTRRRIAERRRLSRSMAMRWRRRIRLFRSRSMSSRRRISLRFER